MTKERFDKIMSTSKTVSVFIFHICFYGSGLFLILFQPEDGMYWALSMLSWVLGLILYATHGLIIPFFIEKVLKIEIEK
jgi:hypothetical protein